MEHEYFVGEGKALLDGAVTVPPLPREAQDMISALRWTAYVHDADGWQVEALQ
jgi:hypothetical protein